MISRRSMGPLVKAMETLKVFARNAPDPRELLANRTQRFDRIHGILPTTVEPGEKRQLILQVWDQCERIHRDFTGTVRIESTDPDGVHPESVSIGPDDAGFMQIDGVRFESPGVHYLTFAIDSLEGRFTSNPVRVVPDPGRRTFWGDIHLHSTLSDGTGLAEHGYRFARDVMALDVVAYTDHDTMGFFIPPAWQRERMHRSYFDRLCALAESATETGSFVAIPAYEWTKQPNVGGHLNVYFEDADDATLFDSHAADSETYEALWKRLRAWEGTHDSRVVTVPHHPAEAMYPFDFASVDYDDELAPVVEVYSQWGSSERPAAAGNEFPLAMGQGEADEDGYYVRDAHRLGYRVGMIGGSDYHGPHPGHSLIHSRPHLPSLREWREGGLGWSNIWRIWAERSYPGGLTAFLAPELSRSSIISALAGRSVYATTQPHRILVDFTVNGVDVADQDGAITVDYPAAPREIGFDVWGTEPVAEVTVLKNNESWRTLEGTDQADAGLDDFHLDGTLTDASPIEGMRWDDERGTNGDVYALRVRQASDRRFPGTAWVGPLWVEPA